jgi:hypothetical protein
MMLGSLVRAGCWESWLVIPAETERVIPAPAARMTAKVVKNIRPMKALVQSPEYGSEAGGGGGRVPEVRTALQRGVLTRFLGMRVTNYVISITSPPPFDQLSHLIFNAIDPIRLVIAITAHKWLLE